MLGSIRKSKALGNHFSYTYTEGNIWKKRRLRYMPFYQKAENFIAQKSWMGQIKL